MVNCSLDISVVLLTYNHERYVKESLNSILNQKFNGNWEIIIADDCSNDCTFEIIQLIKNKHKSFSINAYSNELNLGLSKNYEKAILNAKGKYIAYLEGDDYWIDVSKLQKQFDFLENNSKFILAFHDFVLVDANGLIISDKNLNNIAIKKDRSKKDMITGCLIHQNSMMFRNVITKFPLGFFKAKNHDTFLIAYLSRWGEAGYVKCNPLHYRIRENTLWSSLSGKEKHFNGLITYLWIFSISSPQTYFALVRKVLSKIKSIILLKLT